MPAWPKRPVSAGALLACCLLTVEAGAVPQASLVVPTVAPVFRADGLPAFAVEFKNAGSRPVEVGAHCRMRLDGTAEPEGFTYIGPVVQELPGASWRFLAVLGPGSNVGGPASADPLIELHYSEPVSRGKHTVAFSCVGPVAWSADVPFYSQGVK